MARDIPAIDLVRAELQQLHRDFAASDAACFELRRALTAEKASTATLTEIVATMIHRAGEAGTTVTSAERRAAWDACWLRISVDFLLDDDDKTSSVRVSLMPPTADERKENAARVKEAADKKEAEPSKSKLIMPDP